MNQKPAFISIKINVLPIVFAATVLGAAQVAKAANGNDTWAGNGGSANWSTAGNWASGSANKPPIGGDALIFITNGPAGSALNNDITASTAFNAITFNGGANAFTFSGNAINLAGNITDDSVNIETIDFPMAMTAARTCIVTNGGNLVLSGVISGGYNFSVNTTTATGNQITPLNTGTVTLNGSAVNTYSGTTIVSGGTLLLDFANLASPTNLINSSSALTLGGLGGGTLNIKGQAGAVGTAQTFGNVTLTKNSESAIVLNPNGGTGTTLTLGNTWSRNGGACTLNIDLSGGGTLTSTPSIAVNNVLGFATVKDANGVGFASVSGGNIVRLTGQATLPTSTPSSTTDYITSGNETMSSASFEVNSLTLDASSGPGTLDLGGGSDQMLIASLGLLMFGENNYIITNGQVGANNVELDINQMGTGTLTIDGTIGNDEAGYVKNGPGTLVVGNTNSDAWITINQGTVQQGVANAIGATNMTFSVNNGAVMDLNGYDLAVGAVGGSGTGQGIITNSGALANFSVGNGNGAPDLANATVCGPIQLIITGSGSIGISPANTHTGGTTFQNDTGSVPNYRVNVGSELGTGPLTFNGGGTIQNTSSLTITNAVVVNGVGNGWWVDSGTYGSSGPWSGAGTINVLQDAGKSATFTFSGDMSGFHGTLLLTANTNSSSSGVIFNYSLAGANTFDGSQSIWDLYSIQGAYSSLPILRWAGTGSQTIKLGDLNSSGSTGNQTAIVSNSVAGTVATFNVGYLNQNSGFAGAIVSGAGTIALTKVGTGKWTLSGTNTYTGNTTISGGILALTAPIGATSLVSNSPAITIAGAAAFDVSGMGSTFVLGLAQTLANIAGTATLAGNLNTGEGAVSVSYGPGTPAFIVTNGTLTLSAATSFNINNTGSALAAGSYEIISTATTGNVGLVAGAVPAVTVSGGGIAAGAVAALQISNGDLYLVVSGGGTSSQPSITGISLNGTTLTITATNGTADRQYVLLQSTNVALPLSEWTPVLTNTFDGSGNLNLSTNIINPNNKQDYFILQQ